jgi:hypothetical protein
MPKPSTHRMHDPESIVPHIWPKVFTDNQMSRKSRIITWIMSLKTNMTLSRNGTTEDSITPQEWQSRQRVAYNSSLKNSSPSSPSEQQVWVGGENSKIEYIYGWYSASAINKWFVKEIARYIRHKAVTRNAPTLDSRFISFYFLKLKL